MSDGALQLIRCGQGRTQTWSIPIDGGSVAVLRPLSTHRTDEHLLEKQVTSAEIVIETGELRLALGRGLTVPEQVWLISRINEFSGTAYPACCPECGAEFAPAHIDLDTQRLSCTGCDWQWTPSFFRLLI